MRQTIKNRALKCIDEVYPGDNSVNRLHFPLEDFLDEAGRRIVRAVPIHALGEGSDMSDARLALRPDGSGVIFLPTGFVRLIRLRMGGWHRPVTMPIRADHPLYRRQFNHVTRGGTVKPVAALIDGDTQLEYFSVPVGQPHSIEGGRYFGFSCIDDTYPANLVDVTAWQLAALVLSSMNDVNGANTCQNKVNEYIALL